MKKQYLAKLLSFIMAVILLFTDFTAYAANITSQTVSGNSLSGNSISGNTFSTNQIPEKTVYKSYWDGEGNFSNLIIFVKFADTLKEHSYDSEYIKLFEGDEKEFQGLRDYFYNVSNEKLKVETIIPQYDSENEKITTLALPKEKSEYIIDGAFAEKFFLNDVAEKLNESEILTEEMILHSSDAESMAADYFTIIVPEETGNPEELIMSHNGVCETEEDIYLGENTVYKYSLITENDLQSEAASLTINNLFWERLGYRNYTGNKALVYPTADYLASYLGWLEIPELTETKTSYTLEDSKAVMLKTALSDTEYFVVEYRKELSEKDGTSDLLIYRVDAEAVFDEEKEPERIEIIPYGAKMLYANGDKSNIVLNNLAVTEEHKVTFDITFGKPEKKIVGWHKEGEHYYYYDKEGNKLKGVVKIDGKNYYFDNDYRLATGWKKIGSKYRFFNNSSDYQKCYELSYTGKVGGWITLSDGRKSYITSKNVVYKGLKTISNKKYYFDSVGIMKKKYWKKSGDYYYYAGSNGSMVKGAKKIGTKTYYFDSNCRLSTGWKKINGKYRFFNNASNYKDRYELTYTDKGNPGGWVTLSDGRKSYIHSTKGILKGWQTISKKSYYFNSKGLMLSGWRTINGKKYFFDLNGVYRTLSKPTIASVTSSAYGKATIKWKKVTGVDDFVVQCSTNSRFSSGVITKKVNNTTSNKTTVTGLKANKTYYFRVKYTVQGGNKEDPETASSKYSSVKSTKIKGEVSPTSSSAKISACKITGGSRDGGITVQFKATLKDRLKSADKKYYIVQTASYGTAIDVKTPCAAISKDFTVSTKFNIKGSGVDAALMNKFALAIKKSDGTYQLVSTPKGITNPEFISENTVAILKPTSKKGLQGVGFADAADTNSKHTLFNLDLAKVVGTKAKSGYVAYKYKGKTYYFSDCRNLIGEMRQMAEGYDQYIQGMTGKKNKVAVTLNILLSYNSMNKYLIDPAARKVGYRYYTLNVREEKARETLEAVFMYLGEIFGQEDCYVTHWILGNEVNSSNAYNYAGSLSQNQYMKCYAAAFRLLYNGVKASKTGNNVYISLDNGWCAAPDTYTGKSTLDKFAFYVQEENPSMRWSIAYHGYSYPLTRNDFWNDNTYTTKSTSTRYISMKNISVITKYAASLEEKYDKPSGSIRVILSEQGYNAGKGETSQAQALARGYYMAEFNSRIDAFIIRAIQDAKEEVRGGLKLGVKDLYDEKRTAYYVYEYMDSNLSKFGKKNASQMVSSRNVKRYQEAQKILCKTNWKAVILGYKESKLNAMY